MITLPLKLVIGPQRERATPLRQLNSHHSLLVIECDFRSAPKSGVSSVNLYNSTIEPLAQRSNVSRIGYKGGLSEGEYVGLARTYRVMREACWIDLFRQNALRRNCAEPVGNLRLRCGRNSIAGQGMSSRKGARIRRRVAALCLRHCAHISARAINVGRIQGFDNKPRSIHLHALYATR